jgi:hypothetical protein
MRSALINGLIGGLICILINAFDLACAASTSLGPLGDLVGLFGYFLAILLIMVVVYAGRAAAEQTGTVRSGALAGLLVSTVTTLVTSAGIMVQFVIAPSTVTRVSGIAGTTEASAIELYVIEQVVWFALSLAICAGLGALGGAMGRRTYRQAG